MNQDLMVNPHQLGLSKGRYWSSGKQLPVIRVIARVLADPVKSDLEILKKHFGIDMILETWQQLLERQEVAESIIPITELMLKNLLDNNAP